MQPESLHLHANDRDLHQCGDMRGLALDSQRCNCVKGFLPNGQRGVRSIPVRTGCSDQLAKRLEFYATWILAWATEPEVQAVSQLATHAWPDDVAERYAVLGHTEMIDFIALDIKTFAKQELGDAHKAATTLMAMLAGALAFRSGRQPLSDAEANEQARYFVGIFCNGRNGWCHIR